MKWHGLGTVSPLGLSEARLQAHYAAQVVASLGKTYLDPRPDDSHPNLGWEEEGGLLTGRTADFGLHGALRLADLTLQLRGEKGQVADSTSLRGRTLEEALAWLAEAIGAQRPAQARRLTWPGYELPSHGLASAGTFSADQPALEELGRWFSNADRALKSVLEGRSDASEVRIWPHHFDIGSLIALDPHAGEEGRFVGLGLSPGDENYAQPYWYVSPYPNPSSEAELPQLEAGGAWHTQGFVSAVLTGDRLVEDASQAEVQADRSHRFLSRAIETCLRLVG